MNVLNINSTIEITHSQKSFVEEVLFCESNYYIEEDSFYWLSKQIPIFLINEDSMKKYENKIRKNEIYENMYEPNDESKPHTEWLGFYERSSSGLFENTPIIAICPERIAKIVKNDEEFMFLLAKVIVHEFAHVKMDYRNENKKYRKKDTFWTWMEESMANQLTLGVFRDFTQSYHHRKYRIGSPFKNKSWGDELFNFVVEFIKKQPPNYALGFELFDKRIRQWWIWQNHKYELGGQKKAKEKSDWLKYMQKNYTNIDEKKAELLYDAIFKVEVSS